MLSGTMSKNMFPSQDRRLIYGPMVSLRSKLHSARQELLFIEFLFAEHKKEGRRMQILLEEGSRMEAYVGEGINVLSLC
jgi:hypothetical protein